jgi:hypothetical protein
METSLGLESLDTFDLKMYIVGRADRLVWAALSNNFFVLAMKFGEANM